MAEAGLSCTTVRPENQDADLRAQEAWQEEFKKYDDLDNEYTVITIDQTQKALATYLTHGWFQKGERPTRDVSGTRENLKLLDALTNHGETLFLECESNLTSRVAIHFLEALQQKFGEKITVVLDHTTCFTATVVKDFAADTAIELIYFPRHSPQLNPSEEC